MGEGHEPALPQRVDAHDVAAPARSSLQGGEHARVVGARVLPHDQDQVGALEVGEAHGALADADRGAEARAARLVAEVRAVGQVVGAEPAHQQLVEEGGLVAGAPRGVEDRLVRGVEGAQHLGDAAQGGVPADGLVAVRARRPVQRPGEPALRLQPVVALAGQRREGPALEEVRVQASARGLVGDRLGAVLAELEGTVARGLGPRAARAVEALLLVDPREGGHDATGTVTGHLARRGEHGREAARGPIVRTAAHGTQCSPARRVGRLAARSPRGERFRAVARLGSCS